MAFTRAQVAEIYVATFNRAPDAAGLDYWVNGSGFTDIEDVASSFFDSAEAQVMYPSGTSATEIVTAAYTNLFNRAPDQGGLDYWVGELESGSFSQSLMLQALINGAQDTVEFGNDSSLMANKAQVGLSFADSGLDDVDAARNILLNITDDDATVADAELEIDDLAVVAQSVVDTTSTNTTSIESTISVESGFTESWLDGRTLWSVDQAWDDGSTTLATFEFNNNINTAQLGLLDSITTPVFSNNYTITSDGILKVDEGDNYEYYEIRAIDGTKISLSEGEDLTQVINDPVTDQWFFTNQTDAQIFYNSLI